MYQWRLGGEAQIADIQNELVSVNRQIDDIRDVVIRKAVTIADTEAEINGLEQERGSILAGVAALLDLGPSNLSGNLQLALDVLPRGIQLTSIYETVDQITLVGDADKKATVAGYVLALERLGLFDTVYVTYLSEEEYEPPVFFSIIGDSRTIE
jgi:Tfp pilus assembly protein PilN